MRKCLASEKMWENFNVWVIYFPVWLVRKCGKMWALSLSHAHTHTLFSSCDLPLGCVACVRVYGCLAVGLGIAIFVFSVLSLFVS